MAVYIGPAQIVITRSAVPTDITAGEEFTFDSNDGVIFNAVTSQPYQLQVVRHIAVFGTDDTFDPNPPDPDPSPIPDLPAAADPPFPPVWPYLFSSDTIYGRDTVGVIQTMVRQDTYRMDIVATQSNNGNALDLTGALLTMTARFEQNSPTEVFSLTTTGGGIVITDATAGAFTVTIPSSATAAVPLVRTELFFDIQYALGSVRYTISRGILVVLPDTTTS